MSFIPAIGLGSINMPELLIILVIVLVFFGAGKLPSVFRQLGSGMKAFKDAQKDEPEASRDVTLSAKELTTDAVTDAEEVGERVKE